MSHVLVGCANNTYITVIYTNLKPNIEKSDLMEFQNNNELKK